MFSRPGPFGSRAGIVLFSIACPTAGLYRIPWPVVLTWDAMQPETGDECTLFLLLISGQVDSSVPPYDTF